MAKVMERHPNWDKELSPILDRDGVKAVKITPAQFYSIRRDAKGYHVVKRALADRIADEDVSSR